MIEYESRGHLSIGTKTKWVCTYCDLWIPLKYYLRIKR